ncbi:hypothetical protein MferCBS31731_000785 [Microsporum ferrugineum]
MEDYAEELNLDEWYGFRRPDDDVGRSIITMLKGDVGPELQRIVMRRRLAGP